MLPALESAPDNRKFPESLVPYQFHLGESEIATAPPLMSVESLDSSHPKLDNQARYSLRFLQ